MDLRLGPAVVEKAWPFLLQDRRSGILRAAELEGPKSFEKPGPLKEILFGYAQNTGPRARELLPVFPIQHDHDGLDSRIARIQSAKDRPQHLRTIRQGLCRCDQRIGVPSVRNAVAV